MATNDKLAKLVAEIATDGELPKTSAEYLAVLHRAVNGGFAIGVISGQTLAQNIIDRVWWRPLDASMQGFDDDDGRSPQEFK